MRPGPLAVTLPSLDEIEAGAKSVAAVGGIAAGVWAAMHRWRKRRREREARREAEARALRYLVDVAHHVLRLLNGRLIPEDEMRRQEVLIRQVREQLAEVDGHVELLQAADEAETRADLRAFLTRTQAIQRRKAEIRDQHDNPFRDQWTPEGK